MFESVPLPIWINETEYREYYYKDRTLSKEEAVSAALREMRDRLDEILETAEISSSSIKYGVNEKGFIIKCDLTCIVDIASVSEFNVDKSDNESSDEKN